jgi:hypothetical protein
MQHVNRRAETAENAVARGFVDLAKKARRNRTSEVV